jgi:hypothetical protein
MYGILTRLWFVLSILWALFWVWAYAQGGMLERDLYKIALAPFFIGWIGRALLAYILVGPGVFRR